MALSEKQLEKFKKELLKRRDDLLKMRERHHKAGLEISADLPRDSEEALPLEGISGVISEQEGIEVRELERIGRALRKVEEKTYGICEVCEENIGLKRLRAIPYATLCISCQEEQERSSAGRERRVPYRLTTELTNSEEEEEEELDFY